MRDPSWAASTAYAAGTLIVDSNGNVQQCTTAGNSGAGAPIWPSTVDSRTHDGNVVWTVRMLSSRDTTKLVEEAKLYWTVQGLVAPAVGYLLSHFTSNQLQNSVFCVLALVPIIVGAVYNIGGAGYIYEARVSAGLPIRRDFFCGWMAIAYLIMGGVTAGLLGHSIGRFLGIPKQWDQWALPSGFALGAVLVWVISRDTYKQVEAEFTKRDIPEFDQYLHVKRLYDLEYWEIIAWLTVFVAMIFLLGDLVA